MALIQCPDCKEQVSDSAPTCPKCGRPMPDAKPPKQKLTAKHYIILAVVIIALASILRARHPGMGSNANATQAVSAAEKKEAKDKETLKARLERQYSKTGESGLDGSCTATALYREYNSNEVAADAKYKGKWVQVRGVAASVAKDIADQPYVALAADAFGMAQVQAFLFDVQIKEMKGQDFTTETSLEKAAAVKSGQKIMVECRGEGSIMGIPRLGQCLILPDSTR